MIQKKILAYLRYKNITSYKFTKDLGFSTGFLNKQGAIGTDKYLKIIQYFPDLNPKWLLTGEGEMLQKESMTPIYTDDTKLGVPLIPLEAIAGKPKGEIIISEIECERFILPMFKTADFLIYVEGDSMQPKYHNGDIVACKKVALQDLFFQWNKVYVLDTQQGSLIKRVHPSDNKDEILLVSDNIKYKSFSIKIKQLHSLALVVGLISSA